MISRGVSQICAIASMAIVSTASQPASAASPARGASRISLTATYIVRGIDNATHTLYVEDTTYGALRQSQDWGLTFSKNKGFPEGVDSVGRILSFGSRLYVVGRDRVTGLVGVYRAAPASGDQPFSWSGPTHTVVRPGKVLPTDFSADGRFLYLAEYGDPVGGPSLYRSADGVTWQRTFGPDSGLRHIHAVAPDPYVPGSVWMTVGDGVPASIWRSAAYGAPGTWQVVVRSSSWQSVQISFTQQRIYLAADTHKHTMFVIDRKTMTPRLGTAQYFQRIRPPSTTSGALYLWNAFYGAVDPSTGVYYCVANDESGQGRADRQGGSWQGLFVVRRLGGQVQVLDQGGININMNGQVFIGGGRVWAGQWSAPLIH